MLHEDILNTRKNFKALCNLARKLGYNDPYRLLINNDGSCVGDLIKFFEDNPGAIETIIEWAAEHLGEEDSENLDEDE